MLAALGDARESGGSDPSPDGATQERLDDLLRPESVVEALQAVSRAEAGEPERMRWRALAEPWLHRATTELTREWAARAPGDAVELLTEADPDERRRAYDRRLAAMDGVLGLREEWMSAREDAARRVGAPGVTGLLAAGHPVSPEETLDVFRRGAIEPLDDAVAAAVRDRRRSWPSPLNDPPHPADGPALRDAMGFVPGFDREALSRILVRAMPRSGQGLTIRADDERRGVVATLDRDGEPCVGLGAVGGPGSLTSGLAAAGQTLRARFLRGTRGAAAWRFADPAFHQAAGVLFRRLALSPEFRALHGPPCAAALDRWMLLEEALAPRRSWNYLFLMVSGRIDALPTGDETEAAFRRADGEPPSVDDGLWLSTADPRDAAALRGTVLGLLQEERLLSRFGYGWFDSRVAARWLSEIWEAEPGETAEGMARLADLGTIEMTPVLDRCRPELELRR